MAKNRYNKPQGDSIDYSPKKKVVDEPTLISETMAVYVLVSVSRTLFLKRKIMKYLLLLLLMARSI